MPKTAARIVLSILFATASFLTVSIQTATPASAAGCWNTGCDNKGPKAMGCRADQKTLTSGGGGAIQLRYSDACRAMWAYAAHAPYFWDEEIHLEMQKKVDGKWVFKRRLTVQFEVGGGADWTNMLGSRWGRPYIKGVQYAAGFRFRALQVDPAGGQGIVWATKWAHGGNR